jgi:2-amino-4-hydroxy-6-hydroxymethyldihydropteridine diphosphokinase
LKTSNKNPPSASGKRHKFYKYLKFVAFLFLRYNQFAMTARHQVYLALGTNLGDRLRQLKQALDHLESLGSVERLSRCYETKPVGYQEQPDFLNLACRFTTQLEPDELLKKLKAIEQQMGREPSFRNAPRPIDIDILFFDDLVLDSADLVIPHPRISERAFVLAPLADIEPEIVHPVLGLTVREMLERSDRQGITPFQQAEVIESFYLETQDGLFFSVKGAEHPPDRWIAVLRYAPDPQGNRIKNGVSYRRLYSFSDQEIFLDANGPQYLAYDPFFQTILQSVPKSLVRRIHDPRLRLQELMHSPDSIPIEKDAAAFAALLKREAGVPWHSLGISGSLLIGLDTDSSDLDISVFGEQNCYQVYRALLRLLDDRSCDELDRLDKQGMDQLFEDRSADTQMDAEEFFRLERRKVNQGQFRNRVYFIRFIKEAHEAGVRYGQLHYTQLGRAKITATVTDDREAIFTPCRYILSDVQDQEGRVLTDLAEIVSFRARFCEQARAGEFVEASGMLELVQRDEGHSWQRLLLGNSPVDTLVLRRN